MQTKFKGTRVEARDYKLDTWVLKDEFDNDVYQGDVYKSFRGEPLTILGGQAPHKPSSTGRIHTSDDAFFPGVCNLRWVLVEKQ